MFLTIQYFLIFLFYAFLGWLGESLYVSMAEASKEHRSFRFINRGFLRGPVTPIYGVCGLVMTFALVPVSSSYWKTIVIGIVLCDAVEYFTSWSMEKLFHARWWDYTGKPWNINGRIDLKHTLIWGGASLLFTKVIWPVTSWLFRTLRDNLGWDRIFLLFVLGLIVFVVDLTRTVSATADVAKIQGVLDKFRREAKNGGERIRDAAENLDRARENIRIATGWRTRHIRQIYRVYPSLIRDTLDRNRPELSDTTQEAAAKLEETGRELIAMVREKKLEYY